jgi:signal transduction histidine kinase
LYLIFDRALSLALQRLDELADIADSRHQLAALIAHQVRTVGNEPSLFAVFFDQRPRLDDTFSEQIIHKEREYVRRITAMVTRAIEAGELSDVDPRHATHAIIGMTSWLYKWFDPAHDDPDEIARTMIRLILGDDADADSALAYLPAPNNWSPTSAPLPAR